MKRLLLILTATALMLTVSAQTPVLEPNQYYLPKTTIEFRLLVEHVQIMENGAADSYYSIASMKMNTIGTPDKEILYNAANDKRYNIKYIHKNAEGIILAINTKVEERPQTKPFVPALRAEQALTEGQEIRDTTEYVLTYTPRQEVTKQVLFRFSQDKGLTDDTEATPYYISIEDLHYLPTITTTVESKFVKLSMKGDEQPGIFVIRPGKVRVTLHRDNRFWTANEFYAAQFGKIEPMNPELFSAKMRTQVIVNPVTGNVDGISTGK
ncbi:MAG: DUF4831 family protein [Prevotella sp.]|nr:DUF4831 family protein [Prevotella sp.]